MYLPSVPVEAVITLSLSFATTEIAPGYHGRQGLTARWPWVVDFTFGLLHGFGFASALSEIGLLQNAILIALLFFNVGMEADQLLFVGAFTILATLNHRIRINWPRWVQLTPAYIIGSIAMFWVIQRVVAI